MVKLSQVFVAKKKSLTGDNDIQTMNIGSINERLR